MRFKLSMLARIEQLPIYDYASPFERRRRDRTSLPDFGAQPRRRTEFVDDGLTGASEAVLCWTAFCPGCGRGLVSVTRPIPAGMLCSDRCPRTLTPPA